MKFLAIAFLTLILGLATISCGTKKKTTSSEKTEIKKEASIDSSAVSKITVKSEIDNYSQETKTSVKKEIEYDGVEGDSLTITEKGPDGKTLSETVIKGKGKVKIKDAKESTETQKNEILNFDYDAWYELTLKKMYDEKVSNQKAETVKTKTGITLGFWSWFWIIVLIIITICIIYLKKRFKSYTEFKKHVLNVFSTQDTLASK